MEAPMREMKDNHGANVSLSHTIESSIDRIEQIDSLTQFHRFPEDFSEIWIKKISLLPPHCPMSDSLFDLIGFELSAKDFFDVRRPIVLLGNYGAGKTLVAQKLLSLLSGLVSENKGHAAILHKVEPDSALEKESLIQQGDSYTILDTPGWNPYDQGSLPSWLQTLLDHKTHLQFLWVQSSGFDCCESMMLSEKLTMIPLQGLIMTKIDVSMYNGLCLTLPYYTGVPLTLYNDSSDPTTPLFPFFPKAVMDVLSV
jgi:hypothetical protein